MNADTFDDVLDVQQGGGDEPKKAKRARLSLACNQCRKRKVKCDAEMPQCRNCKIRGHECITTDPRNPELVVYRKPHPKDVSTDSVVSPLASTYKSSETSGHRNLMTSEQSWSNTRSSAAPSTVQKAAPVNSNIAEAHNVSNFHEEHQSPMAINRDGSRHRRKLMGRSSLQSLAMVLDICLERVGLPCIAPAFRHGMRHVEEFVVPLYLELPEFPADDLIDSLLGKYEQRVHPMFPIVDVWHIREKIRFFVDLRNAYAAGITKHLSATDISFLACAYAALALGADEAAGGPSELGTTFLNAVYGLYGHLVSMPYLASVQAFLLLTITLRGRSKEGQAFQVLGQAIRIAHSIGMHRNSTKTGLDTPERRTLLKPGDELHARIWWVCFCLEKMFELETARPTLIRRSDCDQVVATTSNSSFPFFVHFLSLAMIMGQISDTLYRAKRGKESSAQLLSGMAGLDEALSQWCAGIPENIRPGQLYCDEHEMHLAMFLSMHYHQAVITLHRTALSIPQQQYRSEIEKLQVVPANGSSASWQRLKKGADLCIQSAKDIIKAGVEMSDNSITSALFTVTPSVLASVVIALQIIRNPKSRMVNSDLELLCNETTHAEEQYILVGQDPEFIKLCSILREAMVDFVRYSRTPQDVTMHSPRVEKQLPTPNSTLFAPSTTTDNRTWSTSSIAGQSTDLTLLDPFQDVGLEDFWATLDTNMGFQDFPGTTFDV